MKHIFQMESEYALRQSQDRLPISESTSELDLEMRPSKPPEPVTFSS